MLDPSDDISTVYDSKRCNALFRISLSSFYTASKIPIQCTDLCSALFTFGNKRPNRASFTILHN